MSAAPATPEPRVEEVPVHVLPRPIRGHPCELDSEAMQLWIDADAKALGEIVEAAAQEANLPDDFRFGAWRLAQDLHRTSRACVAAVARGVRIRLVDDEDWSSRAERTDLVKALAALATSREMLFGGLSGGAFEIAYGLLGEELRRRLAEVREAAR